MEKKVTALNDVDYVLELSVPNEEIEPRIREILKERRKGMNLKGFRPGKVPLEHVRKMVGPQVAVQVTEQIIGEAFQSEIAENEEYEVLGQPRLSEIDYNFAKGGDLTAEVKFAIRPEFELADITGQSVTKYVREFTEEDIEADIEHRREAGAALEDAEEDAKATEKDVVTINIQPVDEEGNLTGPKQSDADIVVADPQLRTELKDALIGVKVGDSKRVDFPHLHAEEAEHDHEDHVDRYIIEVTAVKHRILPEVDAEFIKSQTNDESEELDDLKAQVREQLENSWEQRSRQALEGKMVEQLVEAQEFALPETVVEAALDAMLDEIAARNDKKLPEGFDVADFREKQREQAERQVRWILVKEKFVEQEGIEITEEDFEAEFEKIASDDVSADVVKQYFAENGLINQMGDNMLNQRIFGILEDRFEIVEKTREDLEREREEREAAEAKANKKGFLSRFLKSD